MGRDSREHLISLRFRVVIHSNVAVGYHTLVAPISDSRVGFFSIIYKNTIRGLLM